jgi:hypothetical protein
MEDKDAKKAHLSRLFWWENTECPLEKYTYISVIIHSTQEVNIPAIIQQESISEPCFEGKMNAFKLHRCAYKVTE